MADILLDNGDITPSLYGDIAVVTSYDEIIQSAINNIYTIYGENIFHPTLGNKIYGERLKISQNSLDLVKKNCIDVIMTDDRILHVQSINARYDDDDKHNIYISFTIVISGDNKSVSSSSIKIYV